MNVEETIGELVTKLESQKLKISALEDAVLNLQGFYRETKDGSLEGRIRFGTPDEQVAPVAKTETRTP